MFWALLWVPRSWAGRVLAFLIVGVTAASTMLTLVFIPLALVRLYARRRWDDLLFVLVLVTGVALHVSALLRGITARPSFLHPTFDLGATLDSYVRWALPHAVLGWRWLALPLYATTHKQFLLTYLAWAVVLAAVGYALVRRQTPLWGLAAVAGLYSVGLHAFQFMSSGRAEERYVIAPELLLLVVMAALLRPSGTLRGSVAFSAFAVLFAVVVVVNYPGLDSWRTRGPGWDASLREGIATCARQPGLRMVPLSDGGGIAVVPCAKLR